MSKSPLQTAMAVANSMVGTSLLVIPIHFLKKGIIQNGVATIIMSVIMCTTAVAIGTLVSGKQKQFYKVVKLQLGIRWSQTMAAISSLLLILVACIVFLLATTIIHQILEQVSDTINEMSPQLFKTCLLVIFIPFFLLNSLQFVVKFSFVSMALMWVYIFTIGFSFFENIKNVDQGAFQLKSFSVSNIQLWLSVQGFAFICHPSLDSVLKQNKKSQSNAKAVIIGYIISFLIILSCGILGSLALYKKQTKSEENIIQYFKGQWQYFVLAISIVLYLFSIFPIFPVVSRLQCQQILPQKYKRNLPKTRKILKIILILIFITLNQLFIWLKTGPTAVMGFLSSIVCFYVCYLLPLLIKIRLIRKTQIQQITSSSSLIQSVQYLQKQNAITTDPKLLPVVDKNTRGIYLVLYSVILVFGGVLIFGEIWYLIQHFVNGDG